jgi:hypothetical protein
MGTSFRGVMRCLLGTRIAAIAAAFLIAGCVPSAEVPKPSPVEVPKPSPVGVPAHTVKPAPGKTKVSAPVSSRQQRQRERAQAAQKGL